MLQHAAVPKRHLSHPVEVGWTEGKWRVSFKKYIFISSVQAAIGLLGHAKLCCWHMPVEENGREGGVLLGQPRWGTKSSMIHHPLVVEVLQCSGRAPVPLTVMWQVKIQSASCMSEKVTPAELMHFYGLSWLWNRRDKWEKTGQLYRSQSYMSFNFNMLP